MPSKNKAKPRKYRVKKCDKLFSILVRLSHSNEEGYCSCITCGKTYHRTKIQNGHFISRGVYKYRRDRDNCFPQDMYCNVMRNGNYTAYTLKMIDKYGREWVDNRINDKKIHKIPTRQLQERVEEWEDEIVEHLKKYPKKAIYENDTINSIKWAYKKLGED